MNNSIEKTSTFNEHIKSPTSEKFTLDISSIMNTNTSLADNDISLVNNTTFSTDNTASLMDISLNKSSNETQTSITADKGIENQIKRLFDLHEQTYDHAIIMYQKQEKMEKMIGQ